MNTNPLPTATTRKPTEWEQLSLDRIDRIEEGIADVRADLDRLRVLISQVPKRETGQ